jgi:Ca-activated chloride channel family protein
LYAGLKAGFAEVQKHYDSGRQNRVILLSDGVPTAGITATQEILSMSRQHNSDGIGLTSIGLGSDFNIDLMRGLALQADGNFYFLENAGAVTEVFTEELGYFTVPVAFDLDVRVRAGESYDFRRALGSPFWTDTADGGTLSVPSVFIAHRDSADDITDAGGRRGGGSTLLLELMPQAAASREPGAAVATVDLTFREPGTNRTVSDSVPVTYPYAAGELRREGYFWGDSIPAVQKSFVMLNIFVGMELAVRAFHSGLAGIETIAALDNLIAAVEDYNEEVADTDIRLDLEMLNQLRTNLVSHGVPDRKAEPASNPWPAD